MRSNSDISWFI